MNNPIRRIDKWPRVAVLHRDRLLAPSSDYTVNDSLDIVLADDVEVIEGEPVQIRLLNQNSQIDYYQCRSNGTRFIPYEYYIRGDTRYFTARELARAILALPEELQNLRIAHPTDGPYDSILNTAKFKVITIDGNNYELNKTGVGAEEHYTIGSQAEQQGYREVLTWENP